MLRTLIEILLTTTTAGSGAILLYFFTPDWGLLGFFAGLGLLLTGAALTARALGKVHSLLACVFGIVVTDAIRTHTLKEGCQTYSHEPTI